MLYTIDQLLSKDVFPHFVIITGSVGSGRKTLARYIGNAFGNVAEIDVSVDSIRNMIDNSYKIVDKSVFIIPDADNMSLQAKNALLKVTEEPPNDAYFIMTLEDQYNTLQTIRSRGTIFTLENYSKDELMEFINEALSPTIADDVDENWKLKILKIAQTPGEIKELVKFDVDEFYKFVELVIDNIADSQLANTFKLADKLSLNKDDEGYNLKLFFRAFTPICLQRMSGIDAPRYATGVSITSSALRDIGINGISKPMLVDNWILEMRKAWS